MTFTKISKNNETISQNQKVDFNDLQGHTLSNEKFAL